MSGYGYSTELKSTMAKAVSHSLPISFKSSIEVCSMIKGKPVGKAKEELKAVIAQKKAVPMTRFFKKTGHKKGRGMATGKYPIKVCKYILKVIESAEANAQHQGLSSGDLVIHHIVAQEGPRNYSPGRTRGMAKRTHIEVVLDEQRTPKKLSKKKKKEAKDKKETPKKTEKKAEKESKSQKEEKESEPSEKAQKKDKKESKDDKPEEKAAESVDKKKDAENKEEKKVEEKKSEADEGKKETNEKKETSQSGNDQKNKKEDGE